MSTETPFERLWAPWRMPWIRESKDGVSDCFICDALRADTNEDRENLLLYRGENALIILNRYPYSNGHMMVAPTRHLSDPRDLNGEEFAEIGLLTQLGLEALEKAMHPHGFNIGWNIGRISGAGLEQHLHQHIVPRWSGDTNFVPVIGGIRVISQDLWETFDDLKASMEMLKNSSSPLDK